MLSKYMIFLQKSRHKTQINTNNYYSNKKISWLNLLNKEQMQSLSKTTLIISSEATISHKRVNKNVTNSARTNNSITYLNVSCNVAHKSKNATLITRHSTKPKVNTRVTTRK